MPHLIIEYTPDYIDDLKVTAMIDKVFDAARASGLFAVENIKVRAIPVTAYRTGNSGRGFVRVQCRIHVGRSSTKKKALSEAIVAGLRDLEPGVAAITAEVVEMDPDSYARYYTD